MNGYVSHQDVAQAAGVTQSTVSRVLSGKAEGSRIPLGTRDRVRSVALQLGYQTGQNTRFKAQPPVANRQEPAAAAPAAGRTIGLITSLTSPASTLALVPSQEPDLSSAGFNLLLVTLPTDPQLAQGRIITLIRSGVAGLLCCPSAYSTVAAITAGACPVIAISPWSTTTLLKSLGVPTPTPVVAQEATAPVVTPPAANPIPEAPQPPALVPPPTRPAPVITEPPPSPVVPVAIPVVIPIVAPEQAPTVAEPEIAEPQGIPAEIPVVAEAVPEPAVVPGVPPVADVPVSPVVTPEQVPDPVPLPMAEPATPEPEGVPEVAPLTVETSPEPEVAPGVPPAAEMPVSPTAPPEQVPEPVITLAVPETAEPEENPSVAPVIAETAPEPEVTDRES